MKPKIIILTGSYTSLYFLFLCVGTLLSVLIEHSPNMKYAPAFTALLAGSVYMLLIAKTKTFGALTLMSAVLSLFFFLSGHFVLSVVPSLFCGLLADGIARLGRYNSRIYNLLSYIVFSFGNLSPITMMWVMREAYIQQLIERGKDAAYIESVMVDLTLGNVSSLLASIVILGFIGGGFGQYLVGKHFVKAGMVD